MYLVDTSAWSPSGHGERRPAGPIWRLPRGPALRPARHGLRLLAAALLLIPLLAGATDPLRVVVISDLNGSYGSTDYGSSVDGAVRRILALRPDLVISTGDLVAGQRRPHLRTA